MQKCIYVQTYLCLCPYVVIGRCAYVLESKYVWQCIYIYTQIRACMCVDVHFRLCVHSVHACRQCVHVYMRRCTYVYMRVHVYM